MTTATTPTLRERAGEGIVLFCGAGVSMVPPTCLPSWWEMNERVIEALANQVEVFCGAEKAAEIARLINERRASSRFPPEFQAEIITEHFGQNYFKVLECLDGEEANRAHLAIAELAGAGCVRAIVTSNFDRLLEVAFRQRNVPLDVHYRSDDFEQISANLNILSPGTGRCQLIKLHGSVDDHSTLVDTLAQRMRGLSPAIRACLRHLLHRHHWVFMGYSGSDLEADSQYMGIATEAESAVGFNWLVRDSSKSEPKQAVKDLCSVYGDRASTPRGELPEWLEDQFADLLGGLGKPAAWSDEELTRRRAKASQQIIDHTTEWAGEVGSIRATMALANMLENAVSDPVTARDLLSLALKARGDEDKAFVALGNSLANTLSTSGDLAAAKELALQVLDRVGAEDEERRAGVHSTLGLIEEKQGHYQQALERFEQAHAAFAAAGQEKARSIAIHNRAMVIATLGRFDDAQRAYEEELEIVTSLGDTVAQAQTLNNLGELFTRMDRYDEAIDMQQKSIALRERLGDDRGVAYALGNIAATHQKRGDLTAALATYEDVLKIFRRIGDKEGELTTNLNMGKAARDQGRLDEAEGAFRNAIAAAAEHGLEPQRATGLWLQASVMAATDRGAQALLLYNEALTVYRKNGNTGGEADVLNEIGIHYWRVGDLDRAEKNLSLAMAAYTGMNQPASEIAAGTNLALVASDRGDVDQALAKFHEVLTIAESIESMPQMANIHYNMGALLQQTGDTEAGMQSLDAAQGMFADLGMNDRAVEILSIMGEIRSREGKIGEGYRWFDQAIALASSDAERTTIANRLGNLLRMLLDIGRFDLTEDCIARMNAVGAKVEITRAE